MKTTFHPALPIDQIFYDAEFNSRGEFTLQSVKDLADSIVQVGGLIAPITVQPWGKGGFKYRLLVGHRRFKAVTTFLRWKAISANIVKKKLTEYEARLLNVAENLERKDLNILEEARAIRHLFPQGVTIRTAAATLKKPTRWVFTRLKLLTMPEEVQERAAAGLLSAANLDRLGGMERPGEQVIAAEKIADARVRGKGKFLKGLAEEHKAHRKTRNRSEINRMIERMMTEFGISGLPTRMGAWCANQITDDEFLDDLKSYSKNGPNQAFI